jgi:hypothetical protein
LGKSFKEGKVLQIGKISELENIFEVGNILEAREKLLNWGKLVKYENKPPVTAGSPADVHVKMDHKVFRRQKR